MVETEEATVLLQQAISYSRESLAAVTPSLLPAPTACARWNLLALLAHLNESVATLVEGTEIGHLDLLAVETDTGDVRDPVSVFHEHTDRLLRGCARYDGAQMVSIADRPLAADFVVIIGAIEIAVHGWDISVSCGERQPIPSPLADGILSVSSLVIHDELRYPLFSAPVGMPPSASASDRLVALLGRDPRS
jgi:uncharacterized protein (TIGR03086 family)